MIDKTMTKDNPHNGHRKRLRNLVERAGLDSLNENQVMEFILYYIIPRRDTNEIAHKLLKEFGCVCDVICADYKNLQKVSFLGDETAKQLQDFKIVCEYYEASMKKERKKLKNIAEVIDYFNEFLQNKENYEFYALALNENNEILDRRKLCSSKIEIEIQKRTLYDFAYKNNSCNILLAHNHPNGNCLPTESDDIATGKIIEWLNENGIQIVDHIIIGKDGAFSFKNQKIYV